MGILKGKKDIRAHFKGMSWAKIDSAIDESDFPAVKWGNEWMSETFLADEWMRDLIRYKKHILPKKPPKIAF